MRPETLILIGIVVAVVFYHFNKNKNNPPRITKDTVPSREHLRELILGKRKRAIINTRYGFTTNDHETRAIMYKDHYRFGKLFEMASKSPDNTLKLSNGDSISPHSREHGLESGRSADRLRINVLKEYGIDIATMEDLEVGDQEFIARRKAELIAQIEKDMDKPDKDPSDPFGNLPTEG